MRIIVINVRRETSSRRRTPTHLACVLLAAAAWFSTLAPSANASGASNADAFVSAITGRSPTGIAPVSPALMNARATPARAQGRCYKPRVARDIAFRKWLQKGQDLQAARDAYAAAIDALQAKHDELTAVLNREDAIFHHLIPEVHRLTDDELELARLSCAAHPFKCASLHVQIGVLKAAIKAWNLLLSPLEAQAKTIRLELKGLQADVAKALRDLDAAAAAKNAAWEDYKRLQAILQACMQQRGGGGGGGSGSASCASSCSVAPTGAASPSSSSTLGAFKQPAAGAQRLGAWATP
jgi:hypothetical protein